MQTSEGNQVRKALKDTVIRQIQRGEVAQITATEKPKQDPIISQEITAPGVAPVPPEPVPDCSQWRYFVESWVLTRIENNSYSMPVLTGYDRITYNFGDYSTYIDVPRFVNIPVAVVTFIYEWVAQEFNGCGVLLNTHRSGIFTESNASYTDQRLANCLIASDAQVRQLEAWSKALVERSNAIAKSATANSPSTAEIYSGVFQTSAEGLAASQRMIEQMMRDYAERVNVYNSELEQYQISAEQYQRQQEAKQLYDEQVEITSNMIREDKVGTAYTVKGAGNQTISLTVGQEVMGSDLISSGIQSIGSGHNIDPHTTYIITDVELTRTAPRVNVPGLWGTSFPGKIVITK